MCSDRRPGFNHCNIAALNFYWEIKILTCSRYLATIRKVRLGFKKFWKRRVYTTNFYVTCSTKVMAFQKNVSNAIIRKHINFKKP